MAISSVRPSVLALAGLGLLLLLCLGPGEWQMLGGECCGGWGRGLEMGKEMGCCLPAFDPSLSLDWIKKIEQTGLGFCTRHETQEVQLGRQ